MNKRHFPKPTVVVSECLGYAAVRFNGQKLNDHFLEKLAQFARIIPICPEVGIGLGVPRFPVRLVNIDGEDHLEQKQVQHRILTAEMRQFSENFFASNRTVHGFVLKYGSPSCGTSNVKVYHPGDSSGVVRKSKGLFAAAVTDQFPYLVVEDEGRLKNYKIREHFLTAIFTLAKWDAVQASGAMKELVKFHSDAKYLLMAYNQNLLRQLGKIVANHEKNSINRVFDEYGQVLKQTLAQQPRRSNFINAIQHMAGYFSTTNSSGEKLFFQETLEMYRDGRIPLSSVMLMIKSWAIRDQQEYILNQMILEPFPRELTELSDAGRMIDL